jgi:predicted neuraminidase
MVFLRSVTGIAAIVATALVVPPAATFAVDNAILQVEFIYESATIPSCHASTIAETPDGLVAAWFGGLEEGDVSVGIWLSRHASGKWTPPEEVADGVSEDGKRYPCWNPVLFQPAEGPLLLFYKVGPSPREWWGMLKTSSDHGKTWSDATRLPDGILGPIKNKPIEVEPGVLLCGSSTETVDDNDWRVHMERYELDGSKWSKTEPIGDGREIAAIQPTILRHGEDRLQILCRTRQRRVGESWSEDGGRTWSELVLTDLPNPSSGIDGVTLADPAGARRHVLIYNPTERDRSPLVAGVSRDGRTWSKAATLEDQPGEYSYPAVIQSSDGKVHVTYTWKRERIKHVVLSAEALGQ